MTDGAVTIVGASGPARSAALDDYLEPDAAEAAERDANAWVKALRDAAVDGTPFRDRFTYRGDSLWWFAEIYLHKERVIANVFRTIAALETLVARERPHAIEGRGAGRVVQVLGPQVARARGVAWRDGSAPDRGGVRRRVATAARGAFHTASALADRLRPGSAASRVPARTAVAAFVHAAFWRRDEDEESYIGPVLRAVAERVGKDAVHLVGLGPRTGFRGRGWRHRVAEFGDPRARALPSVPIEAYATRAAIRPSLGVWRARRAIARALGNSEALRAASVIRGYDAWPVVRPELGGIADLQFPWSARAMDEAGAALDALRPGLVLTYAEAGGWGRALVLEARRRAIPSVGVQHGFIYRHWLNYRHEPDEMQPSPGNPQDRGFPRPDLTLLFDRFAAAHLAEAGAFPPGALAVVGSPRLERFREAGIRLTAADRERIRGEAGARPGQRLVIVASKFTQIAPVFGVLVGAVGAMADVCLVVKCHPAETAAPYARVAAGVPNVVVAPPRADLPALVACADLVVTVNSTAAIEAMVLDVPALVLGLPNNLTPFVDAGAMAGVAAGTDVAGPLRALLYDEERRERLRRGRRAFLDRYAVAPDGGAAGRAAEEIVRLLHSRDAHGDFACAH